MSQQQPTNINMHVTELGAHGTSPPSSLPTMKAVYDVDFLNLKRSGSGWRAEQPRANGNDHFQNPQEPFELFLREPGEKCVRMEPETRVPNAAMFYFSKEDHTLGNLLRAQLHKNPHVWFSGYKVPHPLFPNFELRVQTDGQVTPKEALEAACRELVKDLEHLRDTFSSEWELKRVTEQGGGYGF